MKPRYHVTIWHGETHSVFYVVDSLEQFATVSYRDRESAQRKADELNCAEANFLSRSQAESAERAWARGDV